MSIHLKQHCLFSVFLIVWTSNRSYSYTRGLRLMIPNHSNHLEVVHTEFLCSGLKHPKVIYIFNSNTPLPYKRYKGLTTSETWGTTCFPLTHSKLNQCKQLQSKKSNICIHVLPHFMDVVLLYIRYTSQIASLPQYHPWICISRLSIFSWSQPYRKRVL